MVHRELAGGSELYAVGPIQPFDIAAAERAAAELLRALGMRLTDELRRTPERLVAAYIEMLTAPDFQPTTFDNAGSRYTDPVRQAGIPFVSVCEHHGLPFRGVADVCYLPGDRLVGLSKLPRVVEFFARRFQVQERLTVEIADWLDETLAPRGVGVRLVAEHFCMSLRGVRVPGVVSATSATRGLLDTDAELRREWLDGLPPIWPTAGCGGRS